MYHRLVQARPPLRRPEYLLQHAQQHTTERGWILPLFNATGEWSSTGACAAQPDMLPYTLLLVFAHETASTISAKRKHDETAVEFFFFYFRTHLPHPESAAGACRQCMPTPHTEPPTTQKPLSSRSRCYPARSMHNTGPNDSELPLYCEEDLTRTVADCW